MLSVPSSASASPYAKRKPMDDVTDLIERFAERRIEITGSNCEESGRPERHHHALRHTPERELARDAALGGAPDVGGGRGRALLGKARTERRAKHDDRTILNGERRRIPPGRRGGSCRWCGGRCRLGARGSRIK